MTLPKPGTKKRLNWCAAVIRRWLHCGSGWNGPLLRRPCLLPFRCQLPIILTSRRRFLERAVRLVQVCGNAIIPVICLLYFVGMKQPDQYPVAALDLFRFRHWSQPQELVVVIVGVKQALLEVEIECRFQFTFTGAQLNGNIGQFTTITLGIIQNAKK